MRKYYVLIIVLLIILLFLSIFALSKDKKIYFSLNGKDYIEINIGEEYEEEGYKALYCTKNLKLFCEDITDLVEITKNNDEQKNKLLIIYKINYKNEKEVLNRVIISKDLESPNIVVDEEQNTCQNKNIEENKYRAFDNVDGDITDKVLVEKKDNKVFYSVSDSAGNKRVIYKDINNIDYEKPSIKLNGNKKVYLFLNQEYKEKGYLANDNCDGDLTKEVKISNNIDNTKPGEYKITYSVTDSFGNTSTIDRTIVVYKDTGTVEKNGKVVYLTFDDGPCVYTDEILKVLDKYNVRATFFVTNQFSNYKDLIKKEYESGHTVAVHTYSHNYKSIYSSLDAYINDFNEMNAIIYEQTGEYSNLFRFPGGSSNTVSRFNRGVVTQIANKMTELGNIYFDWNIDSNDTRYIDANKIFESVIHNIDKFDESVVLMHDVKQANIESVDKILKYGLDNGYTFLPLTNESFTAHHGINN